MPIKGWARPHTETIVIDMRQEGLTYLPDQRPPF